MRSGKTHESKQSESNFSSCFLFPVRVEKRFLPYNYIYIHTHTHVAYVSIYMHIKLKYTCLLRPLLTPPPILSGRHEAASRAPWYYIQQLLLAVARGHVCIQCSSLPFHPLLPYAAGQPFEPWTQMKLPTCIEPAFANCRAARAMCKIADHAVSIETWAAVCPA